MANLVSRRRMLTGHFHGFHWLRAQRAKGWGRRSPQVARRESRRPGMLYGRVACPPRRSSSGSRRLTFVWCTKIANNSAREWTRHAR
jgi:hypothetical protein